MTQKHTMTIVFSVFAASLLVLSSAVLAQAAVFNFYPWMTQQGDAQRSGFTQSPAPVSNETYWRFQTGGPIESSPVAANGLVYVTSGDGYLYAVNATNGAKAWAARVGNSATSPTLTQDRVFVVSSGTVFAFDAVTGAQAWNYTLGQQPNLASPLAVGSRLFVSGNDTVYAFNEAYGVKLYDNQLPHVTGIVRLDYTDGLVVAIASMNQPGFGVDGFEAVNTIGRFWMYLQPSGKDRYSSFLVDESAKIFAVVTGEGSNSSAFGLTDMGLQMWEHQIQGATTAFPASAYNMTFVPTSKNVYALNATDGSVQWSRPTSGAASASSPAVADGEVFFGLDDGYVYALDAFNGSTLWSYKTGGAVRSSPAISDGLLFVGSDDGYIYAIGNPVNNGASAIPELPTWAPILVAMGIFTAVLVAYRTRVLRRDSEQGRRPE